MALFVRRGSVRRQAITFRRPIGPERYEQESPRTHSRFWGGARGLCPIPADLSRRSCAQIHQGWITKRSV